MQKQILIANHLGNVDIAIGSATQTMANQRLLIEKNSRR